MEKKTSDGNRTTGPGNITMCVVLNHKLPSKLRDFIKLEIYIEYKHINQILLALTLFNITCQMSNK